MTQYEEYMSRKGRRSRERKKRINERVQGLSAVPNTDPYTYQAQSRVSDTLKTVRCSKVKLCCSVYWLGVLLYFIVGTARVD